MSKTEKVENHLLEKGNITSWEAIQLYRATRLSAIIFNLRKKYQIRTEMHYKDGESYAEYIIEK